MCILELIALVFQEASLPASKSEVWPFTNGALRSRPLASLWRSSKPRWLQTARRRWCRRYNSSGLVGAPLAFSKVSFHGCVPSCIYVSLPTTDIYSGVDRSFDKRRCASLHRVGDRDRHNVHGNEPSHGR